MSDSEQKLCERIAELEAALAAVEQKQRERDAEIAKNYYSDDGLYGLTDAESKIAIGIANAILAKPEAK
jgi:hypothetical protein